MPKAAYDKFPPRPLGTGQIKGDAGTYNVWGFDWFNRSVLLDRCGTQWVPMAEVKIAGGKLNDFEQVLVKSATARLDKLKAIAAGPLVTLESVLEEIAALGALLLLAKTEGCGLSLDCVAAMAEIDAQFEEASDAAFVNGVDATIAAVGVAVEARDERDGMLFLRYWDEGEFDVIRRNWPEAPETVFIGPDVLYVPSAPQSKEADLTSK